MRGPRAKPDNEQVLAMYKSRVTVWLCEPSRAETEVWKGQVVNTPSGGCRGDNEMETLYTSTARVCFWPDVTSRARARHTDHVANTPFTRCDSMVTQCVIFYVQILYYYHIIVPVDKYPSLDNRNVISLRPVTDICFPKYGSTSAVNK